MPSWARFFTETDLSAVIGAIHTDLALTDAGEHAAEAVGLLDHDGPELSSLAVKVSCGQ